MRTSNAVLVLCLNIGVDPPDVTRPSPSARTECWIDPRAYSKGPEAMPDIARALQAQYERWQRRAKYKVTPDPTTPELRRVCMALRRNAREERVLFHYNGHGVPMPTVNGEIWVFSRDYTQYIPLSLYEVQEWVGLPGLYVFDCNCGGLVVNEFLRYADVHDAEALQAEQASLGAPLPPVVGAGAGPRAKYRDAIILAACGVAELLPMQAELPADLFTCCLTTPIKTSLRWFLPRCASSDVSADMLDRIPGSLTDRQTPLGALNWIFTAVTDTIAWNVLPRDAFKRLFRQDLLLASLMRNFLLADRIMRSYGCTPVSHPPLPPTHQHKLWQSFEHTLEHCIVQLPEVSRQVDAAATAAAAADLATRCDDKFKEYCAAYNLRTFGGGGADAQPPAAAAQPALSTVPPGFEGVAPAAGPAGAGTEDALTSPAVMNGHAEAPAVGVGENSEDLTTTTAGGGGGGEAEPGSVAAAGHTVGSAPQRGRVTFEETNGVPEAAPESAAGCAAGDTSATAVQMALKVSPVAEVEEKRREWLALYEEAGARRKQGKDLEKLCTNAPFQPAPFFEKQMESFAVWVDLRSQSRGLSDRLPIMLQVLLSQTYRVNALHLLSRYLQSGPEAVDLALSIGYFPYVEKLLSSSDANLKKELVFIWGKIIALDPSTVCDLHKMRGEVYLVNFLGMEANSLAEYGVGPVHLVMAEFGLSCIARLNAQACRAAGVVPVCQMRMDHVNALVRRWACLCVNEVVSSSDGAREDVLSSDVLMAKIEKLATVDEAPDVRAASISLLSTLATEAVKQVQIGDQPVPTVHTGAGPSPGGGHSGPPLDTAAPQPVGGPPLSTRAATASTPIDAAATTAGTGGYEATGTSAPSSFGGADGTASGGSGGNQSAYHGGTGGSSVDLGTPEANHAGTAGAAGGGAEPPPSRSEQEEAAKRVFQVFASVLVRASSHCASVLVRREVARALAHIAVLRLDMFRLGHQLLGLQQQRQQSGDVVDDVEPGSVDASCRDLFVALRRYSFDPHPIVYGYAHLWFEKILDDTFSHQGSDSFGGGIPENRSSSGLFGMSAAGDAHTVTPGPLPSTDSFASGISVVSGGGPAGSLARSPQLPRQPSTPPHTPGEVRSSAFVPAPVAASAADSVGHVRSGSGNLDLSRVVANGAVVTGLGEAHELYQLELSRRHSTGSSVRRGSGAASGGGHRLPIYPSVLANGVGLLIQSVSQTFNLAPKRGSGGADGRGIATRVGGDGNGGCPSGGVSAGGSDSSDELFLGVETGRGLAVGLDSSSPSLGNGGGNLRRGGASTRVGFSSDMLADGRFAAGSPSSPTGIRRPRQNMSYQVLNRLASSPPRSSGMRLPMPRVGSFVVVPRDGAGPGSLSEAARRPSLRGGSPAMRSDTKTAFIPGPGADNASTLYNWSVDCISRLGFETDSPDCMLPDSDELDFGYFEHGYSFCAPDEDVLENRVLEGGADWDDGDVRGRDDSGDRFLASWTEPVASHKMAASPEGGSVLAMLFLPRQVGPGLDSLIVTGDSNGRVGVYDALTGVCNGSFGIPGPPGVESAGVTAVLSLNTRASSTSPSQPYEAAVILAGAVDGRIAVFKSDLLEAKYSIVSTFQGSGSADECSWASRLLPIGAMAQGQREVAEADPDADADGSTQNAAQETVERTAMDDLRRDGNGLVLSYHAPSTVLAAGGCQHGVVRTWSLETERNIATMDLFPEQPGVVTSLTMAENLGGDRIAYGGSNGVAGLLDTREPAHGGSYVFGRHAAPIVSMAMCPRAGGGGGGDADLVASADMSGWIFLWDARMNGGCEVGRIQAHGSMLTTMAAHPNRRVLASGSQSRCVKMFDETNCMSGMILHDAAQKRISPVTALAFQPDAKLLAVGCADSTVMLFRRDGEK
jgi:WD40 repeat protein